MIITSQAIVLKKTAYTDNSLIVHVLCKKNGKLGLMVKGIHSKKSNKNGLLQLGNIVEITYNNTPKTNLKNLSEISLVSSPAGSPLHLLITQFMVEIVYKSIPDNVEDAVTYLVANSWLLQAHKTHTPFMLHVFLLQFAQACGQHIHGQKSTMALMYENATIPEGYEQFTTTDISHLQAIENLQFPSLNKAERLQLLHKIVTFYTLHITLNKQIVSLPILQQILA